MPNWCGNTLTITGEKKEIARFKKLANSNKENPIISFEAFVPMPKETRETTQENTPIPDWYSWALANWGTKWDACEAMLTAQTHSLLTYVFETAWGPPIEWLIATGKIFPKLHLSLDYDEPGMDFSGTVIVQNEEVEDIANEGSLQNIEYRENNPEEYCPICETWTETGELCESCQEKEPCEEGDCDMSFNKEHQDIRCSICNKIKEE